MLVGVKWLEHQNFVPYKSVHQPLHGLQQEQCETDGSKVPRSTVGTPTGLRYKHYLNLAPQSWNVPSRQAGTKDPDQARNEDPLSLLQRGQENPIHMWTFIWGE